MPAATSPWARLGAGQIAELAAKSYPCRRGCASRLAVLEAIFPVDRLPVGSWKQAAFGLRQMEVDGPGLAAGGKQLSDLVHVGGRLVHGWELLQRDQRRRERLRDHPFVVARDA